MKEAEKTLASKTEVKNALDVGDKITGKDLKTSNIWFKLFS